MGFLTGLFEQRAAGSFHVSQTPPAWVDKWAAWDTASGTDVSPERALEITTVFACVRVLSETVASLPLPLYRRQGNGRKERATEYYLYELLHDRPNDEMTSFELRETMMGHLCCWGNAYAEVELDGAGQVTALWPLRPDRMSVARVNGELVYTYRLSKPDEQGRSEASLPAERVLHVRGLGYDGIVGYSPIQLAREALGLAKATEEFGARFFRNGARPGMVLEHPGKLNDEAHKRLRSSWEEQHQGLERSHRVAILEEGMKIQEVGIPPEDAQFLQTRKFQLNEICRMYRVPPHMVGDLERATFSNVEQQAIDFVVHTIRPWLVRWEQAISARLMTEAERKSYFVEFLVDGLLRGDTESRYRAYSTARQWGWMSANDVRSLENQSPIPGGDIYMMPMNMVAAGEAEPSPEPAMGTRAREYSGEGATHQRQVRRTGGSTEERSAGWTRHRLEGAWRPVIADAAGRFVRRECNDVGNAARKFAAANNPGEFSLWLDGFYREHEGYTAGQMRPPLFSYGELVAADVEEELSAEELGERSSREGAKMDSRPALPRGQAFRGNDEQRRLSEEAAPFAQRYVEAMAQRHATWSQGRLREILRKALDNNEEWYPAVEAELDHWREERPADVGRQESVRFNNALAVFLYGLANVGLRWRAFGESCPYCKALDGKVIKNNGWFIGEGEAFQPEGAEKPLEVGTNIRHAPAHGGCDCMVVAGVV